MSVMTRAVAHPLSLPFSLSLAGVLALSACAGQDASAPEEPSPDAAPATEEAAETQEAEEPHVLAPEGSDVAWRFPEEIESWEPDEESGENGVRFRREGESACTLNLSHWEGRAAELEAEGKDIRDELEDTVDRVLENDGFELESLEDEEPVEVVSHPAGEPLEFTVVRMEVSAFGIETAPQYHGAHWYGDDALTMLLTCDGMGEEGYGHEWAQDLLDVVSVATD